MVSPCLSALSSHVSQPSSGLQAGSEAPGRKRAQWKADKQLDGGSEGGPEKSPPSQVPVRNEERGCAPQSSYPVSPPRTGGRERDRGAEWPSLFCVASGLSSLCS